MTLQELFTDIRAEYVQVLSAAMQVPAMQPELVLRDSNGEPAAEGPLSLPCRVDGIVGEGDDAGASIMVDSKQILHFEPIHCQLGSTAVTVYPFGWDWLKLAVTGVTETNATPALRDWFMEWFDPDDTHDASPEGLYEVLHFMSDPKLQDKQITFTVDLGSAPVEVLEELLFLCVDLGATHVQVGTA